MRFDRFKTIVGENLLNELQHKTVAIFGLGGVGSYAAEAIARSGIGHIILCDFDRVEITNLNRQLIALESTIGMLKTDIMEERIKDINPNATVLSFPIRADQILIQDILNMNPDFVVDAIDDVSAKTTLIKEAVRKDIPIIASMGFANKLHPELITVSTLQKTSVCPLAKIMRKKLKEAGVTLNIPVVYSIEKPQSLEDKSALGTCAYVPSVAGLILASYVINRMIGEHL